MRDVGVLGVYGETLLPIAVGWVDGDMELGGLSRKLILLLDELIDVDGETGSGIVLRDLVGEGIVSFSGAPGRVGREESVFLVEVVEIS